MEDNFEKTKESENEKVNRRIRTGLIVSVFGFFCVVLGAKPQFFFLDRSPVVGFVQTSLFLIGIGILALGGYIALMAFHKRRETTIGADFGTRFVGTGYAIVIFTGFADVFGIGSHPLPGVPFFGPLQAAGVLLGLFFVGLGLLLMIIFPAIPKTYRHENQKK